MKKPRWFKLREGEIFLRFDADARSDDHGLLFGAWGHPCGGSFHDLRMAEAAVRSEGATELDGPPDEFKKVGDDLYEASWKVGAGGHAAQVMRQVSEWLSR